MELVSFARGDNATVAFRITEAFCIRRVYGFFVCLPEVVSKRWHNLIYILSSAIFSFGYAT
ncbi:hypothetical protein, partial [Bacteroides stercoris]|uniref:hypothetical protein n=1 Tax=Bacteroides stercoris TaxID=46506 RepID=UPI0034A3157D